jgi:hypothetical protein
MARISRELIIALKLNPEPAYKLAQRAGINPNTLSKLVNGIDTVRSGAALSEVVAMEAVEGCLEWGLRGVECVAVGGGYFRDGCSRVFFGNVVRLMGTSGEAEAEGAKREP